MLDTHSASGLDHPGWARAHRPAQRTTQVMTAVGVGRVLDRSCLQGYPAEQTAGGPLRQQEAASTVSKALSRKVLANEPSTRWARRPPRLFAQVADDHARNRRHQPHRPALRDLPRDRSNPRSSCCDHVADPSLPLTARTSAAAPSRHHLVHERARYGQTEPTTTGRRTGPSGARRPLARYASPHAKYTADARFPLIPRNLHHYLSHLVILGPGAEHLRRDPTRPPRRPQKGISAL